MRIVQDTTKITRASDETNSNNCDADMSDTAPTSGMSSK